MNLEEVKELLEENHQEQLLHFYEELGEQEKEDLLKQINVSRSLKSNGVILFDWAHLDNKYRDALKFCVFTSTCK